MAEPTQEEIAAAFQRMWDEASAVERLALVLSAHRALSRWIANALGVPRG